MQRQQNWWGLLVWLWIEEGLKWQKVQFLRRWTSVQNSFIPKRATKTVAAEKYNPPPPPSQRPNTHKHTHTGPEYTCNKEAEIKALIQWEGIGSWHKFRVNVWGYLLCWLPFLLSVLHCTPHANVNQGHTLHPATHQAVNLFSFDKLGARARASTVTTGALSCVNVEKYQTVHVRAALSARVGGRVCTNARVSHFETDLEKCNKHGVLFVCLSSQGGIHRTRSTSSPLAWRWVPAGGHRGATVHRASVTHGGESAPHHIEK